MCFAEPTVEFIIIPTSIALFLAAKAAAVYLQGRKAYNRSSFTGRIGETIEERFCPCIYEELQEKEKDAFGFAVIFAWITCGDDVLAPVSRKKDFGSIVCFLSSRNVRDFVFMCSSRKSRRKK